VKAPVAIIPIVKHPETTEEMVIRTTREREAFIAKNPPKKSMYVEASY
jgi:hypothetical protein